MLNKFLILSTLLIFTSCSSPKGWGFAFKPRPISGMTNFPSTETDYGKGFKDGCEGALIAASKGVVDDILKTRINPVQAAKNPDYSNGWYDGSEQCFYIVDWDVL